MSRAGAIGVAAVLLAAAGATVLFLAHPARVTRYAGTSGNVRVSVTIEGAAPDAVTIDVDRVKIDARKLP